MSKKDDWFPYPVDKDARRDLADAREDRTKLRIAAAELHAAWADICRNTPSTYTCGDWSRMSNAVEALVEIARKTQ